MWLTLVLLDPLTSGTVKIFFMFVVFCGVNIQTVKLITKYLVNYFPKKAKKSHRKTGSSYPFKTIKHESDTQKMVTAGTNIRYKLTYCVPGIKFLRWYLTNRSLQFSAYPKRFSRC